MYKPQAREATYLFLSPTSSMEGQSLLRGVSPERTLKTSRCVHEDVLCRVSFTGRVAEERGWLCLFLPVFVSLPPWVLAAVRDGQSNEVQALPSSVLPLLSLLRLFLL